jgi:hypothetical protein
MNTPNFHVRCTLAADNPKTGRFVKTVKAIKLSATEHLNITNSKITSISEEVIMEQLALQTPSHINHLGDPTIPFHVFINQTSQTCNNCRTALYSSTAFFFSRLPLEIQRIILEFCDIQTLFQLMLTSSWLRLESKKVFWSQESVWYRMWAASLILPELASSSLRGLNTNPQFTQHVQQVELDCLPIRDMFQLLQPVRDRGKPLSGKSLATVEQGLKPFWERLQSVFPSIKQVILRDSDSFLPQHFPVEYTTFTRAFPPHVKVFLSTFMPKGERSPGNTNERCLYQLGLDSEWVLLQRPWTRKCITPPRIKVNGPIGTFFHIQQSRQELNYRTLALRWLRREVYEKYHFGSMVLPFTCPHINCNVEFLKQGDYTAHVMNVYTHEDYDLQYRNKSPDIRSSLPAAIEDKMAAMELQHSKDLGIWEENRYQTYKSCGKHDPNIRRVFFQTVCDQLEKDPIFKSEPLINITNAMSARLSITRFWVSKMISCLRQIHSCADI